MMPDFDKKCSVLALEEKMKLDAIDVFENFTGIEVNSMAYRNAEVIPHFPPKYIVGRMVEQPNEILVERHELMSVKLREVTLEWMYSNPTGLFNLSVPEKAYRTSTA